MSATLPQSVINYVRLVYITRRSEASSARSSILLQHRHVWRAAASMEPKDASTCIILQATPPHQYSTLHRAHRSPTTHYIHSQVSNVKWHKDRPPRLVDGASVDKLSTIQIHRVSCSIYNKRTLFLWMVYSERCVSGATPQAINVIGPWTIGAWVHTSRQSISRTGVEHLAADIIRGISFLCFYFALH